MVNAILGELID